ncbi:MAG: hypothetical protein DCC71_15655 [Proteobacteria bacterium]|nr:MAG: hypothetical protein DCC71_15655 [Pseudomonadota bacterium]
MRVALEQQRHGADPDFPRFVENPSPTSKWGAENADNRYLWAPLRPDAVYRVHGRRGTSFELLFEVKEGFLQLGETRNFAARCASDLAVEADGRFELWLGGEARAANWMPLDAGARWLLVREYFADWATEEPARLAIERVGSDLAPPHPTPDRVAAQLDAAARWVEASARCWAEWVAELRAAHRPGRLAPARRYEGGADDVLYGNDWFRLAEDEALIVACEAPDARYWAFQLVDPCFRSLDWAHHQTSLNHRQARVDADGRVRVVVAARDPGVANWLDTTGLAEGVFQYRFVWARTAPQPSASVVPLARLAGALPGDTARVTAEERRAQIAVRAGHAELRR